MQPLKAIDYQTQGKVARYLGLSNLTVLNRFKTDDGVQEIFSEFYDKWIRPQADAAQSANGRGQREKMMHFKAMEMVMLADDNDKRFYQRYNPKPRNVIDAFAIVITNLIKTLRVENGPL